MDTKQTEHNAAVTAIHSVIVAISESGGKPDALRHCYALVDAAVAFVVRTRGREAAYNFVQNRADDIITPALPRG
jgi:hypothetical protein